MKRRRQYNTLGRRILSVLEVGGPRKRTVLRGFAQSIGHDEASLRRALERLVDARLIVSSNHRKGGIHYGLAQRPSSHPKTRRGHR